MLISTKGRYALRVMLELAQYPQEHYIPLMEIAEHQEISEKYLESIISTLSKAGFVDGLRGKGGGYRLNRTPDEYSVGAILRIVEGNLAPVACLVDNNTDNCDRSPTCPTLPVWVELDRIINDYLNGVTLADLMKNR